MILGTQKGFFTFPCQHPLACQKQAHPKGDCPSQKPPVLSQKQDEKGWSKGRTGPALLAASRIGVGFLVDETKGNHYYCIYFINEAYLQGILCMRHKNQAAVWVWCLFLHYCLLLCSRCCPARCSWKTLSSLGEMVTSGTEGAKAHFLFRPF